MAKNVSIIEDGTPKVLSNTTKIRTSIVSGGTCDWIPKDDVPLSTLSVSEDGVYKPDQGIYGFSQVVASGVGTTAMGDLIEKTITKNGTYNITDENGNPYGYSKITVNVDTSDDDSGGGSGGGGSNPVVGKDDDGNDTMVEADDDGNIVITALPTEIKVIIPPSKLEYNRYEEIDYSGISVYAYISNGAEKAVWKSDTYPTGKIPFGELVFPKHRVNPNDETGASVTEYTGMCNGHLVKYVKGCNITQGEAFYDYYGYYYDYVKPPLETIMSRDTIGSSLYTLKAPENYYVARINDEAHGSTIICLGGSLIEHYEIRLDYGSESYHYAHNSEPGSRAIVNKPGIIVSQHRVHGYDFIPEITFGVVTNCNYYDIPITPYDFSSGPIPTDEQETNKNGLHIPVKWKRPGDGKILETTFTAWMKDDGGDNNTSGGNVRPGNQNIDVPQ